MPKESLVKTIEQTILSNLVTNEEFTRKVLPYIEPSYFLEKSDRLVFEVIKYFFNKYNKCPDQTVLGIAAENFKVTQDEALRIRSIVESLVDKSDNQEWLIETTEKFCRDKSIYNAIMRSIQIIEGNDKELTEDALPSLLQEAIGVSFDKTIGHDYFEDAEARYDYIHRLEDKIPFELDMFDSVTNGGITRKTLQIFLAGTGAGKSLAMCHLSSVYLKQGRNVLYITMEMAQEEIAKRIDCNLFNVNMKDLFFVEKEKFASNIDRIKSKTQGNLVIKEYPTSSAHAGHFRTLLNELKAKKNFKPDVIMIDYINICASQRMKNGASNSYFYIKSIAEELRGLAVEFDVPIWSATQTTRGGFGNTDISLTDTSESFGLPATVDGQWALIRTEELDEMGQLMVIQLKSRYGNIADCKKFVIGVDITKFKLYNVEQHAQDDIVDDTPVFDKGNFGGSMKKRGDYQELNFD
jgi:replicative DNA helicase